MNLLSLAKFTTMFALGHRPPLPLNLEERTVGVFAGGGAVTLDTGVAGVLFAFDYDHCVTFAQHRGEGFKAS
jgi:hypothetical protein